MVKEYSVPSGRNERDKTQAGLIRPQTRAMTRAARRSVLLLLSIVASRFSSSFASAFAVARVPLGFLMTRSAVTMAPVTAVGDPFATSSSLLGPGDVLVRDLVRRSPSTELGERSRLSADCARGRAGTGLTCAFVGTMNGVPSTETTAPEASSTSPSLFARPRPRLRGGPPAPPRVASARPPRPAGVSTAPSSPFTSPSSTRTGTSA
mmetsp:Transcript_14432/g.50188  ORF Transcript_14432/g.50188 Transcript_14432/m.50188 type:complete len:207 (-) Transcript_14432:960-1580(-)